MSTGYETVSTTGSFGVTLFSAPLGSMVQLNDAPLPVNMDELLFNFHRKAQIFSIKLRCYTRHRGICKGCKDLSSSQRMHCSPRHTYLDLLRFPESNSY